MRKTLLWVTAFMGAVVVAIVAALLLGSSSAGGRTIAVVEEFKIVMPTHLSPGVHTLTLENKGGIPHELVMFKTSAPADRLPLKADGSVNEESPLLQGVADSGDATKPGGTTTVKTSKLTPGHYVAVCNLPGHWHRGMHLDITVS
jgi:uncharacterized cupredoxin-like copper-binding protein